MMITIYAPCDPHTKAIRYIGQTSNPHRRLAEHCNSTACHSPAIRDWVRDIGKPPEMLILETCDDEEKCAREGVLIRLHREQGCDLLNSGNPPGKTSSRNGVLVPSWRNPREGRPPSKASTATITASRPEDRLRRTLGLPSLADVVRWNDAPGRTAAQVAGALREAAGVK